MDPKGQLVSDSEKTLNLEGKVKKSVLLGTKIFNKDEIFFNITKKTENLISAIYLLTDLFSDREPLKWFLRKEGLKIVSLLSLLRVSTNRGANSLLRFEQGLLNLLLLLETAEKGGIISVMNFNLLASELVKLLQEGEVFSLKKDSIDLEKDFFLEKKDEEKYKGQNKGHYYKHQEKDKVYNSLGQENSSEKSIKTTEIKEKKSDRQIRIIDIIKNNPNVSIKDISNNIKDCSEKTIQRELKAMVKSGVLKKIGSKRWSKYSLNL